MNKRIVIIPVVILIFAGLLLLRLYLPKPAFRAEAAQRDGINKEKFWGETADLLKKFRMSEGRLYYHPVKRDPMQPTLLTGVLVKNRKAAVIINGRIYRAGDSVDGKKIIAIERNHVILKNGTGREIISLESDKTKGTEQ